MSDFSRELIKDVASELRKRGFDIDVSHGDSDHIDIYLEEIKVGSVFFCEDGLEEFYGAGEGLHFVGGFLNYDHDCNPIKIDLANPDFMETIISHIESKRKFIDSDRGNRRPPYGFPLIMNIRTGRP